MNSSLNAKSNKYRSNKTKSKLKYIKFQKKKKKKKKKKIKKKKKKKKKKEKLLNVVKLYYTNIFIQCSILYRLTIIIE